jgi:NAD(P)-dependent dehydrogenase (short-subunit alcohol dehydrogenase family)
MPSAADGARVALVTGANRGLGLETARQLAERGFSVIAGSRDIEAGEAAARRLRADGLDVSSRQLDVTDDEEISSLAAELAHEAGRLDALVNNAGVYPGSGGEAAVNAAPDDLRRAFEVNALGPGAAAGHSSRCSAAAPIRGSSTSQVGPASSPRWAPAGSPTGSRRSRSTR